MIKKSYPRKTVILTLLNFLVITDFQNCNTNSYIVNFAAVTFTTTSRSRIARSTQ
jgi:hypothetical protein